MTWREQAELIERIVHQSSQQHSEAPHPGDATSARSWHKLLVLHRDTIDSHCRSFALAGQWPEMAPQDRWLVELRLGWAWKLCLTLATPAPGLGRAPDPPPTLPHWTQAQLLHWLLIDTWDTAGEARAAEWAASAALQKPDTDSLPPESPPFHWN